MPKSLQQPLGVIIASLHYGASAHVALACHVASIALVSTSPFVTCLERGWLGRFHQNEFSQTDPRSIHKIQTE